MAGFEPATSASRTLMECRSVRFGALRCTGCPSSCRVCSIEVLLGKRAPEASACFRVPRWVLLELALTGRLVRLCDADVPVVEVDDVV